MNNSNKIKFLPLPYIGLFDLDLIYQTSDVELLYQILSKVNEIAQSQNIIVESFQKVLEWASTQIENYTKEQLQTWISDGTIADIINNELFNDLKEQIENLENTKTNLTEYNQNIIQSRGRTYGIYEKGVIASAISNNQSLPPQISGIYPPTPENVNDGSRDSVAQYAYNVDYSPLIENKTTTFTQNSVTLSNFDDTYIPNLMKTQLKDIDFNNTIIDVYTNEEHTYMGYIERYENKTFYLKDGGFYKVGEPTLTPGIPQNGSTIKIGEIKGVFGQNIVVVNTGENNPVNIVGCEIDIINTTEEEARGILVVSNGNCSSGIDIISRDSKMSNGLHLSNVLRLLLADGIDSNAELMRVIGKDSKEFLLTKNGTISPFGLNAQGGITSDSPTVNHGVNVCICVSETPFQIDLQTNFVYNEIKLIMNFGNGAVTIPNIFGGRTITLNVNESVILYCLDTTQIYPIMKGVVGL